MTSQEPHTASHPSHTWSMSEIHTITMSPAPKDQKISAYRQWSKSYDADVLGAEYVAFDIAAEKLSKVIRTDRGLRMLDMAHVLDAGCGTGLCAAPFQKVAEEFRLRFRLTGVDFSEEMLRNAGQRQVYDELYCADMNYPLPVAAGTQHLCMSIGVFLEGHCGPKALGNILACLAGGGYAVVSIRQQHFSTLKEQFLGVIAETRCTIMEQSVCAYLGPVEALYLVLRKGQDEAGRTAGN